MPVCVTGRRLPSAFCCRARPFTGADPVAPDEAAHARPCCRTPVPSGRAADPAAAWSSV